MCIEAWETCSSCTGLEDGLRFHRPECDDCRSGALWIAAAYIGGDLGNIHRTTISIQGMWAELGKEGAGSWYLTGVSSIPLSFRHVDVGSHARRHGTIAR